MMHKFTVAVTINDDRLREIRRRGTFKNPNDELESMILRGLLMQNGRSPDPIVEVIGYLKVDSPQPAKET